MSAGRRRGSRTTPTPRPGQAPEAPEEETAAAVASRTWVTAGRGRGNRTTPSPGLSADRRTKANKRTRQRTQEGGEIERPEKRTRWEPSPVRPSIPFAVALAAARAAAAIGRVSQPPSTTPAARPSWPPTPTRPMDEEERQYYNYYANNYDSLAPKYHEQPGTAAAAAAATGAQAGAWVTSRTGPLPHPGASLRPQGVAARAGLAATRAPAGQG